MWSLHNQAKEYSLPPSAIVGIEDEYPAWCFDQAIFTFGRWVENKLNERHEKGLRKGKPVHRIETLLGLPIATRRISMSEVMTMPTG